MEKRSKIFPNSPPNSCQNPQSMSCIIFKAHRFRGNYPRGHVEGLNINLWPKINLEHCFNLCMAPNMLINCDQLPCVDWYINMYERLPLSSPSKSSIFRRLGLFYPWKGCIFIIADKNTAESFGGCPLCLGICFGSGTRVALESSWLGSPGEWGGLGFFGILSV